MKKIRGFQILFLCIFLASVASSCMVLHTKDNGKHKGYYKNPKNPHNENYMDQGKSKGNHK
jgi:hypothetical protein